MSIKFEPRYSITPTIAENLMKIAAIKERVFLLPLTPRVLASLRETARLYTTHYSTMIEGNKLELDQIQSVLQHKGHFPGRERDEQEVKGYYAALTYVEQLAAQGAVINDTVIQKIHALVISDGLATKKQTPYRDGQNVIRDGRTGVLVYMPPEAHDVQELMQGLFQWVAQNNQIPCPIVASIAHYQFATIHPYYDGNGRTARLLTTLVLHKGGYDLKGLYSLEEYYARHLDAYYSAMSIGPSHNYYEGRALADITPWVEYFIKGMAFAFENVVNHMQKTELSGVHDQSALIRTLDPKQRKVLDLFQEFEIITARQIAALFGFKPRTSSQLCKRWAEEEFLEVVGTSNKNRAYRLACRYVELIRPK